MKVLICPDSYKGSASAREVSKAMRRGLKKVFPMAETRLVPIADGGEGTVESMVDATSGEYKYSVVQGPLGGKVEAKWGILGGGKTAVIEMASASGLTLLSKEKRNPLKTSTYGVGELLALALDHGVEKVIMGIGGSATNDGGTGFASALGVVFRDSSGQELPQGGGALENLKEIDLAGLDPRLENLDILVACDVDNPLCGPKGASFVFGPQKGAREEDLPILDKALAHYSKIAEKTCGKKVAEVPGAGAAGGLGAGLLLFTKAKLKPGIEIVLEALGMEGLVKSADLVVTGEGCTEYQTLYGKAPIGIAMLAAKYNVPVLCLSGALGKEYELIYEKGISVALSCATGPMSLEESMEKVLSLVESGSERAFRLIKLGQALQFKK